MRAFLQNALVRFKMGRMIGRKKNMPADIRNP
jgi:hypothetical protein